MEKPVFKFTYNDKWFNIFYEGRVEIEPVEAELKGSRIIVNGIPAFVVMELERNNKA